MIFLDQSALPIALPSIQRDLHLSNVGLQWTMNAYILALAVLMILGGKLGDKLGHRKIFLCGMLLFIFSSLLCAVAPTGLWLILSRALQGVGGALMMPSSAPLLRAAVPENEMGKMVGLYVAIASFFLMLGPSLGGFLTAYLSWRWIFWINFPIAFAAVFIILFIIPKHIEAPSPEKGFDWKGFISLSVGIICLVVFFMQANVLGWTSPVMVSCLILGILALGVFIRVVQKHPTPFIDFSLFKDRCLTQCILIISAIQVTYMSIIFWAIFLQQALLLSPQKTGIYLLSAQVPVLFFSTVAGKTLDRFGPRLPITLGTAALTLSSLWIAVFCWQNNFLWLLPAFLCFGIGSPFVAIGTMSTAISTAPPEKRGIVSGLISGGRQIGGAIGLALLAAIALNLTDHSLLQWLHTAQGTLGHLPLEQLHALRTGTPLPTQLHLNARESAAVHTATMHAYTLGFSCMMYLAAFFSFIALCMARKLPNQSNIKS
jgi:EmrB/QacA subfamily drug resistance transporter